MPAMWLANANAALWATGNGLVSTLLVIYLAADLGAKGLAVSLILAAPRFAGLLRLGVPALMARLHARKAVCITAYVISSVVLCGVPAVAASAESHCRWRRDCIVRSGLVPLPPDRIRRHGNALVVARRSHADAAFAEACWAVASSG